MRTFSPFRPRVVTTNALQVGAAAEGDNRDHSFPAYRAARRLTHEILLILAPNSELEFSFHSSLSAKQKIPWNLPGHPAPYLLIGTAGDNFQRFVG